MSHHLRLVKALSYRGAVSATKENPDVFVDDERKYLKAMASGYFKEISEEAVAEAVSEAVEQEEAPAEETTAPEDTLAKMSIAELKEYAEIGGIDITGLKRKDSILAAIKAAEAKADEARAALREE